MDWIASPETSYVDALISKVMVFGDMTFSRLSTDKVKSVESSWWDLCP